MNRSKLPLLLLLILSMALVGLSPASAAQRGGPGGRGGRGGFPPPDDPQRERRPPPPDGDEPPDGRPPREPGISFLAMQMRFDGPPKKGAPFTATIVTESTQMLADGTSITRRGQGKIMRDGEGRMRREVEVNAIGPFAPAGGPVQLIFIDDPVAEVHYVLNPEAKTGRKMRHSGPPPQGEPPEGVETRTESLGKKTLEGVEAEGTRSTVVIPAGQIGNDRPLQIVTERWYSSELGITLYSSHTDPRLGATVYQLKGITRAEPSRALFATPSGYTIKEGRRPPHRRGGPRGDGHHPPQP